MEDRRHLCFSVIPQVAGNVSQRETIDVSFCFINDALSIFVFSLLLKNRRYGNISPIFFANIIKYVGE